MQKITFIIVFTAFYFNLTAQEEKTSQADVKYFTESINFDHEVILHFEAICSLKSSLKVVGIERPIEFVKNTNWQASNKTPFSKKQRDAGRTANDERLLFLEKSDPNRLYALIKESK